MFASVAEGTLRNISSSGTAAVGTGVRMSVFLLHFVPIYNGVFQ